MRGEWRESVPSSVAKRIVEEEVLLGEAMADATGLLLGLVEN